MVSISIMGCEAGSRYPLEDVAPLHSSLDASHVLAYIHIVHLKMEIQSLGLCASSFPFFPCPRIDLDLEARPFDSLESLFRRRAAAAEVGGRRRARLSSSAKIINLLLCGWRLRVEFRVC